MQQASVTVRISFSAREVEVSGPNDVVTDWLEKLDKYIVTFAELPNTPDPARSHAAIRTDQTNMPDTFGEYFHRFPRNITDVDRILIACHFIQQRSEENQFTTAEARELLEHQNVRVGNPSECVRRNVDARRVFPLARGAYRVSMDGINHLESLFG
jgi:hypothetical protein